MRQSTSITGCVRRLVARSVCQSVCLSVCQSVCLSVTHSFDDPHVAPYWPSWPCFFHTLFSQFYRLSRTRRSAFSSLRVPIRLPSLGHSLLRQLLYHSFHCLLLPRIRPSACAYFYLVPLPWTLASAAAVVSLFSLLAPS